MFRGGGLEVHVSGGVARLVEGESFYVLQVSGVSVEDAVRAVPGLRKVGFGGVRVLTYNGKPVVPVVGGGVECASSVFNASAWRNASLCVRVGMAVACVTVAFGLLTVVSPLLPLLYPTLAFSATTVSVFLVARRLLQRVSLQVAYGVEAGEGESYFAEAASLCCSKARRLLAEGREEEAMKYALRALEYAKMVSDVNVGEISNPQVIVDAVELALKTTKPVEPPVKAPVTEVVEAPASSVDAEDVLGSVEAYAGGSVNACDVKEKGEEGDRRGDRRA